MSITWSAPWLLNDFNELTGRPTADVITSAQKYNRLTKAQNRIITDIAGICPWVLYPTVGYASMPTCSTEDNQVFTFGLDDDGNPLVPIGRTEIYRSLNDIPDCPFTNYMDEGSQVRIPNNGTYTGTLYWRGIAPPPDISSNVDPILFPIASRALISLRAAITFCLEENRNPELAGQLTLDFRPLWMSSLLAWKTQFASGGAMGNWTGLQLALGGAPNGIGVPTIGF